jgi:hypothetical protein
MPTLIANPRMYAVTPTVRHAWRAIFDWVGRHAGVPLVYIDHSAPAPLEELWSRGDLAATFMCGFPFASATPRPLLVAAPVPSPPRYGRRPVYCTDFVVRALDLEIHRRCFAAVLFDLILDVLPFIERVQSSTLDCRDVDEHVPAAPPAVE